MTAFAKVVDTGGFTAAARKLDLSRAMVSRLVQQLEDDLGTRLLNRTTRRLSLTEAGRAYHERCVVLLGEMAALDSSVSELSREARGTLRVNAPVSFGAQHVAPFVAEFLQRHPQAAIELTLNDRFVNLVEEGYDVAIRIGQLADSSLVARKLAPARMCVCASPEYLSRRGTPKQPADLAQHNCLTYRYSSPGDEWTFERAGIRQSVRVRGNLDANSGEALLQAGLRGLGIALQPTFIAADALRNGDMVQLLPDWTIPDIAVHAVYPHRRHLTSKVRLFVDFLAEQYGPEQPYWDAGLA